RSSGFSGDGGPATNAGLGYPYSVAVDASGNIYVPDDGNQRVREVNAIPTGIAAINTVISIGVYPNPADNYIYVKSNGLKGNITINLYNIEGQQIVSKVYSVKDNIQIPVKQISPGLYFLKAELSNGNTFMKKVIITR
ncbi:MAG TPA: T9SS type A sorting domain-containing protein, partial [Bacteroidia bacterium]|nr:T9SS type A sorting domain-containing protein [Bacteroidia bacterium]